MKLAVIGAGWAGLAAAYALKQAGFAPTVFEAAPLSGGRARRVDDVHMGAIDNGQHLMIGAYVETLKLIASLHPQRDVESLMTRIPLQLENATGSFRLRARRLPSPLHALYALISAKGLSFSDRWQALRFTTLCKLKLWRCDTALTVEQWLERGHQSQRLRQYLWHPLCLATLNTPPDIASAQLFLNVLRDTLDAPRSHSDLIIPRIDLTALWPEIAATNMSMRYRHIVRDVSIQDTHVSIDGESFDACVMAVPPYAALRILAKTIEHAEASERTHAIDTPSPSQFALTLQQQLQAFTYRPIATLTLALAQDWRLPLPLMMLDEDIARGHFGQWVFERQAFNQLSVVISDAEDFLKHERAQFVARIAEQIQEQCAKHPQSKAHMPEVISHRLIVEKRATFSAIPGLARPKNETHWPRLTLAGDWTDTDYPAVLEGAVQSGQRAADILLKNLA